MAAIMALLLVAGIGIFIWKRCDIIPSMCGGVGDNRNPISPADMRQGLSQQSINTATQEPANGYIKSPDRKFTIDTKGGGLSDAALKAAGAKYAHYRGTLGQHGFRLSI